MTTAGSGSYSIDKADELTQQPFPSPTQTTSFTYDAANQLHTGTVSGGGPSYTYSYDSAGNRHTRVDGSNNTLTYNYDQLNRLTSYVPSGANPPTYGYTYNGDGLRMAKSTNGSATASFTWDVAEGLPLLLSDGSTSYVTGPGGLPLEQVTSSGALYFYQSDQLGSTRLTTDAAKASVDTYTYDAYGNLTASTGSLPNPFQYAGQFLDSESGLYYLRARYYDPASGQFVSKDPAMEVTQASFAYSSDNPVNGTDAAGLWSYGLCVTAAAGISFGGFFQFCVVTANLQEFGTTFTTGAGGQSPSASLTAGSQLSSANHLEDLGGPFAYAGGSISAAGGTAGGGCFAGHSAHGAVFGEESQLGIGTPVPVEIHGGGSITVVRRYL